MIGGMLRFMLSVSLNNFCIKGFPIGTFSANFLGSVILSYLLLESIDLFTEFNLKTFIIVGFIGGLTTFSAFVFEVYNLITKNQFGMALIYLMTSLFGCLLGFICVFFTF
tara:strand:- start:539 stop:868 length:330 start_codon:yes stop_codon:yes gene_type:complete